MPNADIAFRQELTEDEARVTFDNCEVCFGNPPLSWVEDSKALKWLQLASAGLDPFLGVIHAGEILVSNLHGFYSRPVAETAVGGILALYRKLSELQVSQQKHEWVYSQIRNACETLEGKQILVLGAGTIGQRVGEYLKPFGGEITYYTRRTLHAFPSIDQLDGEIQNFDIIVGCLAEAPETINLLNAERLNAIKPSAIIVNVGRGSLIDEDHLLNMLSSGKLAGAFLDVTQVEPIAKDNPLWRTPNLLLGQHTAGGTRDEVMQILRFCASNYQRYLSGTPENIIRL